MKQIFLVLLLLFITVSNHVWAANCDAPSDLADYTIINGNYNLWNFNSASSNPSPGIYVKGNVSIGFLSTFSGNIYATGNISVGFLGRVNGSIYAEGSTRISRWATVMGDDCEGAVATSFCDAPPDTSNYILHEGDFTVSRGTRLRGNHYVTGNLTLAAGERNRITQIEGNVYVLGDLVLNRRAEIMGSAYVQGDIDLANNGNSLIEGESCEQMAPIQTLIDLPVDELTEQCSDIFQDAVQSYSSSGKLTMWNNSKIEGFSSEFDFPFFERYSNRDSCGHNISCSVTGHSSTKLSSFEIPTIEGQNIQSSPWADGTHIILGAVEDANYGNRSEYKGAVFGDLTINRGSMTFLAQADPLNMQYQVNSITLADSSAILNLNAGVYAVKNFNAQGGGTINIIGGGHVYLFIDNPSNLIVNITGDPNNLTLILNKGVQIGTNWNNSHAVINGSIYVNGDLRLSNNIQINGRVATENLTMQSNARITNSTSCRSLPTNDYYFELVTSTDALTCEAHSLQVNVKNSEDDSLRTDYQGEITLSTNLNIGTWSLSSGEGSFSSTGNGAASYQFVASDQGSAQFALSNQETGDLVVSVTDGTMDAESETITFYSALIKTELSCIETINGYCRNTANLPFSLTLTALKEDDESTLCKSYNPSGIKFWSEYINPSVTAGTALSIDQQLVAKTENDASAIALTFVDGATTVSANYPDAGQIEIHVKDNDSENIIGQAELIVNPLALKIESVSANPAEETGYNASTGSGFQRAAVRSHSRLVDVDTFDINVTAVIYCDDNTTSSNCRDSDKAASFNNEITLSPSLIFPTGDGALLGTVHSEEGANKLTLTMTGGELTYSDLSYDEVGVLGLQAKSVDYIQSTNDIDSSKVKKIGRFYPAYIAYGDHGFSSGCGDFTYMSEGLSSDIPLSGSASTLSYVMQAKAQASQGETEKITVNYDDGLGYPVAPTANFSDSAYSKNSSVDLTSRILPSRYYDETQWQAGIYTVSGLTMGLQKSLISVDGPYFSSMPKETAINDQLEYYITLTGSDGEKLQSDMDNVCSGDKCRLPADQDLSSLGDFAYGRLQAGNGLGSEYQPIRTLIEATYFNGSEFVALEDDNCTTLLNEQMSATPSMNASNQIIVGSGTSTLSILDETLNNGKGYLQFSAPESRGTLNYFIRLKSLSDPSRYTPWLLDSGNNVTCPDETGGLTDCISGNVEFGLFRGNDRIIYRKQTYQ